MPVQNRWPYCCGLNGEAGYFQPDVQIHNIDGQFDSSLSLKCSNPSLELRHDETPLFSHSEIKACGHLDLFGFFNFYLSFSYLKIVFDPNKDCLCFTEAKITSETHQWTREVLDVMKQNTETLWSSDGTILQIIRYV